MRIVGGQFRGRSITVPNTKDTRPTMDRTREAVFNMLLNAPWAKKEDGTSILRDATVVDVFAGSGAYGLEALSHGASNVSFIEKGTQAVKAIKDTVEKFDVIGAVNILQLDISRIGQARGEPVALVFLDPPYGQGLIEKAIQTLHKKEWINTQTILVVETEARKPDVLPSDFDVLSERIYGKSKIIIGRLA